MKLLLIAAAAALAACQSNPAANNQAEAAPEANKAAAPETDVAAAQRLVQERIGSNGQISFGQAQAGTREQVSVVCGTYSQSGRQLRYIVVNREDVFVESEMQQGEMPRAVAEFCGDGERG
jgi:hypothetical protein